MISKGSMLEVADNSGARVAKCIGVYNSKTCAGIKDMVLISVVTLRKSKDISDYKVEKGKTYKGIIIRTVSDFVKSDGSHVKFNKNSVVLLDKNSEDLLGTRVTGPILSDIADKFPKIASLSMEII